MHRSIIAHELGHAICAEVQDGFWRPCGLNISDGIDDGTWGTCECIKLDTKKRHITSPYGRVKSIVDLGGVFGELIVIGRWSPWSFRNDVDDFITANNVGTKSTLVSELNNWYWCDDDDLSFKACSSCGGVRARRKFTLDHHDTCRRLPMMWDVYLDFCDRINKVAFVGAVDTMMKTKKFDLTDQELKDLTKGIIL